MQEPRLVKFAKVSSIILIVIFLILLVFGIAKDVSYERCSGIMGAKVSCIEEYAGMPFVMIGLPIGAVLVSILLITSMSKDTPKKKIKNRH